MLRAKPAAWQDPEQSVGRQITVINRKTIWEATGPAVEIFETQLSNTINQLLEAHKEELESGEKVSQSVAFHLWMVGREPRTARPTIIITSKSIKYRKKVVKILERNSILADFPGMNLNSMDRMPGEPMGGAHNQSGFGLDGISHSQQDRIVYAQQGKECVSGASIRLGNDLESTLGGVLLINGKYYGMTSFHLRHETKVTFEGLVGDENELAFDRDSDVSSTRTLSLRSLRPTSVNLSFHPSSADLSITTTHSLDKFKNIQMTSEGEKGSMEYRRIGEVQEGYKRNDLDYDIFPVEDPNFQTPNRLLLPNNSLQQLLYTRAVAGKIVEADVWVAAGKSGLIKGTIMRNPYYIKMEGQEFFQKMWPVLLEKDIVPGDCGAWVLDASTGELYGHVVAGDASLHRAYIISAADVMEDIRVKFSHFPMMPLQPSYSKLEGQLDCSPALADSFSYESSQSWQGAAPVVMNGTNVRSRLPVSNLRYTHQLHVMEPTKPLDYTKSTPSAPKLFGERDPEVSGAFGSHQTTPPRSFWNAFVSTIPMSLARDTCTYITILVPNPRPIIRDDCEGRILTDTIDHYPEGYPLLAAWLGSSDNVAMFRRFGKLYARNLLHLQAEITQLEEKLDMLDKIDEADPETGWILRHNPQDTDFDRNIERAELFRNIRAKLTEYSALLSQDTELRKLPRPSKLLHRRLLNYFWNQKPLDETDERFIYHEKDFVLTCDQDRDNWLDNWMIRHISWNPKSFMRKLFVTREDLDKSSHKYFTDFSLDRLRKLISAMIALISMGAFLLTPGYLIVKLELNMILNVTLALGFGCSFIWAAVAFADLGRSELVLSTATYFAILIMFVGNLKSGEAPK